MLPLFHIFIYLPCCIHKNKVICMERSVLFLKVRFGAFRLRCRTIDAVNSKLQGRVWVNKVFVSLLQFCYTTPLSLKRRTETPRTCLLGIFKKEKPNFQFHNVSFPFLV